MLFLTLYHTTLAVREVGFQHLAITVLSRLFTHSILTTALQSSGEPQSDLCLVFANIVPAIVLRHFL